MQAASIIDEQSSEKKEEEVFSAKFNRLFLSEDSPEKILMKMIILFLIIVGVCGLVYHLLHKNNYDSYLPLHNLIAIFSFSSPLILAITYIKSKKKNLHYHLVIFSIMMMTFATSLFSRQVVSPALFWLLIIPILSHLFFTSLKALIWPIIAFLFLLIFYLLNFSEIYLNVTILTLFFMMFATTLISIFYQRLFYYHTGLIEQKNFQIKNFLQIIGHDLATPLFIIASNAEVAIKKLNKDNITDPSNSDLKKWSAISRASESMKDILNIVLDLQALEMGKIKINIKDVDVTQVIEMSILNFSPRLKIKGIEINYENKVDKNTLILVDPIILENQILNNIISNAIKFSNTNDQILITSYEKDEHVIIEVKDSGIGIPKDILYNIFRWDKKTSRKGTSGESGTGFGMPLVQKFVDIFKGKVEVESRFIDEFEKEHGTTVRVFLPKK